MINKIKYINHLIKSNLPTNEYIIVNSAWLALLGIRTNGDLDLIISQSLWKKHFNKKDINKSFGLPGEHENRIRVHAQNGPYTCLDKKITNDELVYKHSIKIDGYRLIEPRLYFEYKRLRFNKIKSKYFLLPWFRRNKIFCKLEEKKIIVKYCKDRDDFKMLKKYFMHKKHENTQLCHLDMNLWGLNYIDM